MSIAKTLEKIAGVVAGQTTCVGFLGQPDEKKVLQLLKQK